MVRRAIPKSPQTPRPVLLQADRKVGFFFGHSTARQGKVAAEQGRKIGCWTIGACAKPDGELSYWNPR